MNKAWTLNVDPDGIAWLTFDLPGEKVNKLTAAALRELDAMLDEFPPVDGIRALVLASGKTDSFIVGADINELARIRDPQDARAKSQEGQAVFAKLAALSVPTVAVISLVSGTLEAIVPLATPLLSVCAG